MIRCKLCDGEEFNDQQEATEHLYSEHSDLIDEKLTDYMSEAATEVEEEIFEEIEEE